MHKMTETHSLSTPFNSSVTGGHEHKEPARLAIHNCQVLCPLHIKVIQWEILKKIIWFANNFLNIPWMATGLPYNISNVCLPCYVGTTTGNLNRKAYSFTTRPPRCLNHQRLISYFVWQVFICPHSCFFKSHQHWRYLLSYQCCKKYTTVTQCCLTKM